MDYRDGLILDLIHNDVSWHHMLPADQEKDVTTVIGRLHATTTPCMSLRKEEYLSTTTTGDSVLVTIIRVFQIMSALHTIMPKLRP
jgi:hypothetical protein